MMEEALGELLKKAELKKQEMKQNLDALLAQSSSLIEVSVRIKVVDAYFDSVFEMIEMKREEAVSEIRVREEEIRVREGKFMANRTQAFDELLLRRKGLKEWDREIDRRERRVAEKEKEVNKRREELMLREERVEALRGGVFSEIHKKKMALEERKTRVGKVEKVTEEMKKRMEQREMQLEEERTRLAKKFDDMRNEMEQKIKWLDQKKKDVDVKVKEVEDRKLNLKKEKKTIEGRAAKLEMKGKEMEKEHCKLKRALSCLAEELECTTSENNALRDKLSLLTQKLEFMAKSSGSSGPLREEGSAANQPGLAVVPSTSNATSTFDGRTLQMYINNIASNDEFWQDEVQTILQNISDPAKIVLDAMDGFYPPYPNIDGKQLDACTVRKTCICLLRKLNSLSPSVSPALRDEALKLAFEWNQKMTVVEGNPLEVTGFLELVMTYGLTREFDGFELLNLSKIAFSESTPLKLLQDLGCADTISPAASESTQIDTDSDFSNASKIAYVKSLISNNQRLQALEYICESGLEDVFPISTMVEVHVNYLKQISGKLLEQRGNTAASQMEATELEIAGLKDLIKCIERHNLQARYSPASLSERITQLERQSCSKKLPVP